MFSYREKDITQNSKVILIFKYMYRDKEYDIDDFQIIREVFTKKFNNFDELLQPFGYVSQEDTTYNIEKFILNKSTMNDCLDILNSIAMADKLIN